jgi:hypothetical protein
MSTGSRNTVLNNDWPQFNNDGSIGYHNMDPEDIIQIEIDLIRHALERAGIPLANYRKFISSGEYHYDDDRANNKKIVRPDTASKKNLAKGRTQSSSVESPGQQILPGRKQRHGKRKSNGRVQ